MRRRRTTLFLFILLFSFQIAQSQPLLRNDFSYVMDVPHMVTMASSPAHLYILSNSEGMAVFRTRQDSLRWLHSSTGMQRRGNKVIADIRYAYLFGKNKKLSVLEPTSLLGVYTTIDLPATPLDIQRIGQDLFIALGNKGLAKVSLSTSSRDSSEVKLAPHPELKARNIVSLVKLNDQLIVLSDKNRLLRFSFDGNELDLTQSGKLNKGIEKLFLADSTLLGSNQQGNIYEISSKNKMQMIGHIDEKVTKIDSWKNWLIIRGNSGRLWTVFKNQKPTLWKKEAKGGNYFTVSKNQLWISEYNQITRVIADQNDLSKPSSASNPENSLFKLKDIQDFTIPYAEPLLFPIKFESNLPVENIHFNYQASNIQDAEIKGQSFYWQPSSDDIGSHKVKITATVSGGKTYSTAFNIQVRSFNAPPRFIPVRPMTIPVDKPFSLSINATDPDGVDRSLIRYIGIDLPKGSSFDESTGSFSWTPSLKQTGENTFRIIATDQYGAASSTDVTINVSESIQRERPDSAETN